MAITNSEREILSQATQILEREMKAVGDVLSSSDMVREFIKCRYAGLEYEMFGMLVLTNRHAVIDFVEMFRGTINGSSVHPRECVREALRLNGAAVIYVHNHPSGVAEPSDADVRITSRLSRAMELIDVRTLDHLIVAGTTITSLEERGLMSSVWIYD